MVVIKNIPDTEPYKLFKKFYNLSLKNNQQSIEAIAISSFDKENNEVDSRYVNLKYVLNEEWIFFSNYQSKKAHHFLTHNQISALFFWNNINVQIRMKGKINQTTRKFNSNYFAQRDEKKNALAISSKQSQVIGSYEDVVHRYNESIENNDLTKCPKYWGGFSFTPYYFEFWQGHDSRINKRDVYEFINNEWIHNHLQP
jgi:pyridoxamine-phosphate oxidase